MIKPWLFEFFHELHDPVVAADPAGIHEHFDFYLDLWTRCEQRGFEGIFFSEHHFGAGYAPSPNLLIAAMAQRTTTLRLGLIGTASPHTVPWRAFEEFAMLDHLTGGRLEAGVVSGIPPEIFTIGLTMPEALARHAEIADVIDAARHSPDGVISHQGEHWVLDNVRIVPRALRRPLPIWTAVRSAQSAAAAGRRGWKVCGGFMKSSEMAVAFDGYRDAMADAGRVATPDDLALRRSVTIVADERDAAEGVRLGKRHLVDVLTLSVGELPPFAATLDLPEEARHGGLPDEEFIGGTAAQVAEQMIEQCRTVGAGNMTFMLTELEPGRLDWAHQQVADVVIPALRSASVS